MLIADLPPPSEGIRHQSGGVDFYIKDRCLGSGTLYIAESRLSWNKDISNEGLSIEYPHIVIHATSTDPNNFQYPCLYLMLDVDLEERASPNGQRDNDESDNDEDEPSMTEVRLVPSDPSLLDFMYKSLSECQVLHPDPEQQSDDGLGEEAEDDDDGEQAPGGEHASLNGNNDDEDDEMDTGQFDDAS